MAHQLIDCPRRDAVILQPGRERMPQVMRATQIEADQVAMPGGLPDRPQVAVAEDIPRRLGEQQPNPDLRVGSEQAPRPRRRPAAPPRRGQRGTEGSGLAPEGSSCLAGDRPGGTTLGACHPVTVDRTGDHSRPGGPGPAWRHVRRCPGAKGCSLCSCQPAGRAVSVERPRARARYAVCAVTLGLPSTTPCQSPLVEVNLVYQVPLRGATW
jgi:hypothetical protein